MERKDIEKRVIKIIKETTLFDDIEITPTTDICLELGIGSLDEIELLLRLEKEFNIQLPEDSIGFYGGITTVDEIVNLIMLTINNK